MPRHLLMGCCLNGRWKELLLVTPEYGSHVTLWSIGVAEKLNMEKLYGHLGWPQDLKKKNTPKPSVTRY